MDPNETKPKRITLTKTQCATPAGQVLIKLLLEIAEDGFVSADEVRKLHPWLKENADCGIPSIQFLLEIVEHILRDNAVTPDESLELQFGIERVLPKDIREEIVKKRIAATPPIIPEPATQKQIDYIRILGGKDWPGIGKWEASELIQDLLQRAPPTSRQLMVLRFWNKLSMAKSGRQQISEWMDGFYLDNPDRMEAWALFKRENGDDGSQRDPACVPIGIGAQYLKRVEAGEDSITHRPRRTGCLGLCLAVATIAGLVVLLVVAFWLGVRQ